MAQGTSWGPYRVALRTLYKHLWGPHPSLTLGTLPIWPWRPHPSPALENPPISSLGDPTRLQPWRPHPSLALETPPISSPGDPPPRARGPLGPADGISVGDDSMRTSQLNVGTSTDVSLKITETDLSLLTASIRAPSGNEEPCLLKRLPNRHIGGTQGGTRRRWGGTWGRGSGDGRAVGSQGQVAPGCWVLRVW